MSLKKLSKNEREVLYGLTKFPLLNDRELAEKLKLNISTLTAIKNRLKKRDYYFTVRIPMMQNVGCELMGVNIFKLTLTIDDDQRLKMIKELSGDLPEAVNILYESDYIFTILIAKNFTQMKIVSDEIKRILSSYDALEEQECISLFYPFQTTRLINYFDFAPILQRVFGIKDEKKVDIRPIIPSTEVRKLSRIEKIVFYGLVKYPDLPDKKIADLTNVTRQVVARLRKDFENENLIRTVRIPNLKQLGFQIMGFAHAKINPNAEAELRKKSVKMVHQDIPTIFWVSGNFESVIISVFTDFDDYKDLYVKGFHHLQKYNFFEELPEPHSISINYLEYIRHHKYAPLVKKVFEITEVD